MLNLLRQKIPGVSGKIYVDTGPLMEKAWAIRAGIGLDGKNIQI